MKKIYSSLPVSADLDFNNDIVKHLFYYKKIHSTGFIKIAQIIILMCFISFVVINCEKSFQSSEEFNNVPIRDKRSLSIAQLGKLAERLKKLQEDLKKERVTDNYKDPKNPRGYGRK
uniref:Selenoprotein n=1 Tax=Strongyloides papillosus TaxID=174720 RepID=A0A0N5BEN2_STREA